MAKSLPRGGGRQYLNHIINSPLLQLNNYPASIMKRIINQRVSTGEGSSVKNKIPYKQTKDIPNTIVKITDLKINNEDVKSS